MKGEATHTEPALTPRDIGGRAASGVAILSAKGIFGLALGLLSTIIVTRFLLPSQLGLYAIALSISGFLWTLTGGIGLAGALIRRPTAPERADLRAFVAFQLSVTTAMAVVVALAALPFGLIGRLTAVMLATTPLYAFRGASAVVLERQLLYKRLATAETAEMTVYYVWTIVTVATGWGVWGLATATVARSVVGATLIVALARVGVIWPRYDLRRIRAILGLGVRVQAVELVASIRDQILVLGTAAVGGVSIVAYWGLVMRALQAPVMLLTTLVRVSFPAMSRTKSAGEDPAHALPWLLSAASVLAGTLLVPLAGAAPALVPLLFGHRWSPATAALSIACLAVVMHMPVVIAGHSYLWTVGDARAPLRAMIADAVVLLVVGLSLVPVIGVLGIAIGGVACATVHTIMLARAIDRHAHVGVLRHIRGPVAAWAFAACTAWACAEAPGPLVARTAASVVVALGLYLGVLFVIRRKLMLRLTREAWRLTSGLLVRHRPVTQPAPTNARA